MNSPLCSYSTEKEKQGAMSALCPVLFFEHVLGAQPMKVMMYYLTPLVALLGQKDEVLAHGMLHFYSFFKFFVAMFLS